LKKKATKNFNAVAIIVTPKRQLLVQNTSYHVQIIKVSPPIFCTAHSFTQPPKSYALQCFSICAGMLHT